MVHGRQHLAFPLRSSQTDNICSLLRRETALAVTFSFSAASPFVNQAELGTFRVVAGGTDCDDYTQDLSGLVTAPGTGGWGNFEPVEM